MLTGPSSSELPLSLSGSKTPRLNNSGREYDFFGSAASIRSGRDALRRNLGKGLSRGIQQPCVSIRTPFWPLLYLKKKGKRKYNGLYIDYVCLSICIVLIEVMYLNTVSVM